MSEETNNRWFSIVSATGLRKNELKAITGDSLYQREDGRYFLKIIGKKHKTKDIKKKREKIYLRGELKGDVIDRKACLIVSRALGHNRPEEFQKSYAYKLIAQAN